MKHFEAIRAIVLEKYALDIEKASRHFSTRNYAFVFDMDYCSVVIRISPAELRTREEVLSEFMWIDDLREFHTHVCQPFTSVKNKPLEEFEIEGCTYRATLFRRAEGSIVMDEGWDNAYFYAVGQALGLLHKASADGYAQGFRYKRCPWQEKSVINFDQFRPALSDAVVDVMNETKKQILTFPQTPETHGLIHGDYWPGNLFTEKSAGKAQVWIIDFDDCTYGYYFYDFVTPLWSWLQEPKYKPNVKRRELLYNSGMLEEYKRGYCENFNLPQIFWDNLELFMRMRSMEQLAIMTPVLLEAHPEMRESIGYDMLAVDSAAALAKENFLDALDDLAAGKYR